VFFGVQLKCAGTKVFVKRYLFLFAVVSVEKSTKTKIEVSVG